MKLEIDRIPEAGNLEKERVVMKANEEVDIGKYVLMRSKKGKSGNPQSGSKSAYWLPDLTVKAGDLVVVYSKKGKSSKKTLEDGRIVHFYYWQFNKAIWDKESNNTAVLLNVREWRHRSP
ncbi:putative uncharacterized protein [Pseudomonas sp. Os17]|uniref:hypothetical protein n=1 Tax=Pseudomonas sp. Os17 TaxID=1500686 RepID=UPI0005FCC460|nr:hypothetical protein [Pseudomonas sp. Os17]BAQ75129.1 putative uncharacterized protein [Pseudomonas sp. Os17]